MAITPWTGRLEQRGDGKRLAGEGRAAVVRAEDDNPRESPSGVIDNGPFKRISVRSPFRKQIVERCFDAASAQIPFDRAILVNLQRFDGFQIHFDFQPTARPIVASPPRKLPV